MSAKTLFTNANLVLDGFAELQKSFDVLVQNNRILSVSQTPIGQKDATVIDIRGRTLIPGLIDAHAVFVCSDEYAARVVRPHH
jgi:imidazolonepropionase-like amidohydrolase